MRVTIQSHEQMLALSTAIGERLSPPVLIFLHGTLGAGKTVFAKGIAAGIGIAEELSSPTFTLAIPYSGRFPMLHVDAYRVKELSEVDEMGIDETLEIPGIVVIEWAEIIAAALPNPDLIVEFQVVGPKERTVVVQQPNRHLFDEQCVVTITKAKENQ